MIEQKCPKCGSSNVIKNVSIADRGNGNQVWSLTAYILEKPKSWFSTPKFFAIRAWICGECGYTELYADNPNEIVSSYQRFLENKRKSK